MIPRISKGSSAYGALAYDHGPGRRDEHLNPHKVAGNVPGRTWQERARVIDRHAREVRPDAVKPLHRTSLRISETDRRLTDREWKQVAHEYVQRMGFERCPWEATRHADDHIHITVNRVQWDGKLARNSNDYAKAQSASRRIEKQHGLEDASRKFNRARPEISKGEKESAQRRQVQPEREQLRAKVSAAERASDGSRASFEAALTERGVAHRANVSKSTGRVSGYSYGLAGHTAAPKGEPDKAREQVWFKGSQLGRDYSWQNTEQRLAEQSRDVRGRVDRPASRAPDAGTKAGRRPAVAAAARSEGGDEPNTNASPARAPMTREQARDEAARRSRARTGSGREGPEQRPQVHHSGGPRGAARPQPTQNDPQSPTRGAPMDAKSPGNFNRDDATQEAQRRAAEREHQRAQERERDRHQEHER